MPDAFSPNARGDARLSNTNLARLTECLSRGLHMPAKVLGARSVGFVVRLDDTPYGPLAVLQVPGGGVFYRDPEELELLGPQVRDV